VDYNDFPYSTIYNILANIGENMNKSQLMFNLRKHLFKILLVLAAITLIAFFLGRQDKNNGSSASTISYTVIAGDVEDVVTAQGKLEPKEYVDVGTQVSGQLKKLYVDIGNVVKKDDVLAEIDPRIYESKVQEGQAALKALEAQLNEQKAQYLLAQKVLERNKRLIEKNAISQQVLEESQADIQIASAKIDSIKAKIEEADSTLNGNKTNLAYTKIYSPIDGTIVAQSAKEGQTINASQTAPVIMQVANLDIMTVRTQVSEADVPKIKVDMPAYFTTLGSQRRWIGTVRQILPSPEIINDVVLYNVLIDVENTDRALMTGMSVQAFFVLGKAEGVPVIPIEYLKQRAPEANSEEGIAYKVTVEGKPEPVIIHIGLSNRVTAQITSGLAIGDVIIAIADKGKPKGTRTGGGQNRGPQL
jgi:macrolide-specific efflux system membrane fusion protein